MKLKRKSVGIAAAVLLLFTMVMGVQAWLPVYAQDLKVSINGEELQDGQYYTFGGSEAEGSTLTASATAPDEETPYIYYHEGVMEAQGNIQLYANGDSAELLQIEHGTLTLTGLGCLDLVNNGNAETLISGTADAALQTEAYTGSVWLTGNGGEALIRGLGRLDLSLTSEASAIRLECLAAMKGDALISAGTVTLQAEELYFSVADAEVKHIIEATDSQNGELRLMMTHATKALLLHDGDNLNASEALLKGREIFVSANGGSYASSQGLMMIGKTVAEGNLRTETRNSVLLKGSDMVVNGNLSMAVQSKPSESIVEAYGENGAVTTGNLEINAPTSSVIVSTSGESAAVGGNAMLDIKSATFNSDYSTLIAGDAKLLAQKHIMLTVKAGYQVIAGNSVQINALGGKISINRQGNMPSELPMFGGSLQTHNAIVSYIDAGRKWVQVTATGQRYYAENCEHPIVNGSYGQCSVCGAERNVYAELIRADGTIKELSGSFGGIDVETDLSSLQDGDTVRFLRDLYANGNEAIFPYGADVTLDLNGHTLQMKNLKTPNHLTIANGTYMGAIESSGTDETKVCTFRNVKATLTDLQWKWTGGVVLAGSEVTVTDKLDPASCWLEKLVMDPASGLTLCDVEDGIVNTAQVSLEEGFGGITGFLPAGYTFAYIKKDADTEYRNTILDEDGQIARNVVLRYRRLTDTGVTVTVKPATCTYDTTAKTPEVVVVHEGWTLVKDIDYTVAYADNINVGSAVITITGKGSYHDAVQVRFTIEKAAQAAPTGLVAVNVSKAGANDGAIHNVSTAMEYSTDTVHWTQVSAGTSVSGLAAGSYYVRYAQTENYLASPAATVVIAAPAEATTEIGTTTDGQKTQVPAKKGTKLTTGQATVKVTNASTKDPQVSYEAPKSKKAKTITVPDTVKIDGVTYKVTSVAKNAFANQKQLKSVIIGKNVTTIGERAFAGCKKLETITIGKSVTKIGKNAFTGCKNLKKITILTTKLSKKSVAKDAFKGVSADVKIVVPKKKLKAYKTLFRQKGLSKKVKIVGA